MKEEKVLFGIKPGCFFNPFFFLSWSCLTTGLALATFKYLNFRCNSPSYCTHPLDRLHFPYSYIENKYIKADSSLFTLRVVIMPVQEKHNMKGEENLIGTTMDFF